MKTGFLLRAVGLAALLAVATLGEGGGSAVGLLAWHLGLVLLLVAVLLLDAPGPANRPASAPAVGFVTFGLLVGAGALRAPYAYGSWLLVVELGACLAVIYLASGAGAALLPALVWPLRIVGALQGLLVLAQRFFTGEMRPAGTFLNPNHASAWLVAVILFGAAAVPSEPASRRKAIAAALALPALGAVLAMGSRGAFIGLVARGAIALLVFNWVELQRPARRVALGLLAMLLVLLAVGSVWRMRQADPFRWQRTAIWSASAGAVVANPLWGSGPGQFSVVAANLRFPDEDGPLRYDRRFTVTHSDPLRVPAEFGIPAAIVLLLTMGFGVREIVNRRRDHRSTFESGALAALLAIGTQSLVDNPSRWPSVYVLACVLIGALLARPAAPRVAVPLIVRVALAGLIGIVFVIGDLGPTLSFLETAGLPRGRLSQDERASLDRAIRLNRIHPDLWLRRAEDLAGDGGSWDTRTYVAAREAAETAVRLQPSDAAVLRRLARIEALACRTLFRDEASRDRAAAVFRRAEGLSRFDPTLPAELAVFLLGTGDSAGARRAAERALRLEPGSVTPRLLLADALLKAGDEASSLRARVLIDEARERWTASERYHDRDGYSRALLAPDPSQFTRLENLLLAKPAPASPLRIAEAYATPRDPADNVDSPAIWHGPGGEHWLLATAKASHRVLVFDAETGEPLRAIGGHGEARGRFARPNGIAVVDDLALVVERDNARVQVLTLPGLVGLGFVGAGTLRRPYGLTVTRRGAGGYAVYVTDNYLDPDEGIPPDAALGQRVRLYGFTVDGSLLREEELGAFGETSGPGVLRKVETIHLDPEHDRLLVAEEQPGASAIKVYTAGGRFSGPILGEPWFPHEAEGLALYPCGATGGWWIATDQSKRASTFHVFDRVTLRHAGSFQGLATRNTDGIAVTSRAFGRFDAGALFAVHDDGNVSAFDWRTLAAALGLEDGCGG